MLNRPEVEALLSMLSSVWTDEVIDDQKITGYSLALRPFSAAAMTNAVTLHMQRSRFFPKPAELIELIAERTPMIPAGEAREIVRKQISKHGYANFDLCNFGDEAILAAVKSVGWRRICLDEDQKFIWRDFDLALEAAQERQRRDVQSGAVEVVAGPKLTALPRVS